MSATTILFRARAQHIAALKLRRKSTTALHRLKMSFPTWRLDGLK